MSRWCVSIMIAAATAGPSSASEPGGWPQMTGPTFDYRADAPPGPMITSFKDLREVWVSETREIGFGKWESGPNALVKSYAGKDWPFHPGGVAPLIVADGLVFASSYRPSGTVAAKDAATTARFAPILPAQNLMIEADDLLFAIDAATGQTAWTATQAGKGLNHLGYKRLEYGVAPVHHRGRIYQLGTAGRLYAYEAKTGRLLFDQPLGRLAERCETLRQAALKAGRFAEVNGLLGGLVVADEVLIAMLYEGDPDTVVGVGADDGKILWEVKQATAKFITPCVVKLDGREFVLVHSGISGVLRLIEPKTGTVVWTVEHLPPIRQPLVCADGLVFLNVGDAGKETARWGAYTLTATGAKPAWQLPAEAKYTWQWDFDLRTVRRVAVGPGVVYLVCGGARGGTMVVVQTTTGTVLQEVLSAGEFFWQLPAVVGSRLVSSTNVYHGGRFLRMVLHEISPDGRLKALGESDDWSAKSLASGYEVPMEPAYAGGRMFVRNNLGQVVCLDLRSGP